MCQCRQRQLSLCDLETECPLAFKRGFTPNWVHFSEALNVFDAINRKCPILFRGKQTAPC